MHFLGFYIHCFYMTTLFVYIYTTYMDGATWGEADGIIYPALMGVGIFYPYVFDTI